MPTKPKKAKPTKAKSKTSRVARVVKPKRRSSGLADAVEIVHERRFEARQLADTVSFAAISFDTKGFGQVDFLFHPELSALIIDRSMGGCSLVFMRVNPLSENIKINVKMIVQFAGEGPRQITARWTKNLDARLLNAGFSFGAK